MTMLLMIGNICGFHRWRSSGEETINGDLLPVF
jgi:hypothetical protein